MAKRINRGWHNLAVRLRETNAILAQRTALLRAREQQLESIAAHVPGLVYQRVLKPDGSVVYPFMSGRFLNALGVTSTEAAQGRVKLLDITHPEDRARWSEAIQRSAADLSPLDIDLRAVLPSGEVRWMASHSQPHREADGSIVWNAVAVDVTERRELESQLRQAQKMEAVGQLTGGIAHDFNNYLGVVIGNLDELIEQLPTDSESSKRASAALRGALRSADLTRQLLAFARKQALDPRAFSINELLTDVVALVLRTLPETIEVRVMASDQLWPVFVDPWQVQDAFINMAINARDAMPEGGTLTIKTGNVELDEHYAQQNPGVKPGAYAVLAVSDTGIGMPPEVLERAFEPFFTTKPVGQGTGLGLSMIYGFAKQSGGHVKIYSEVGHGTIVRLYLPRTMEGAAATGMKSLDEPSLPRGAETVLVAEDNADLRRMAVEHLASLGYRVLEAESGEAALAVVQGPAHIDLLFADVVMSGRLTGFDLAHEANKNRSGLRILLTTGYADSALPMRNGVVGTFLFKPYRKRDLALMVRSILDAG